MRVNISLEIPVDGVLQVAARYNAVDYAGIIILIVGSSYPSLYYGFYCEAYLQTLYISLMTVAGLGEYRKIIRKTC